MKIFAADPQNRNDFGSSWEVERTVWSGFNSCVSLAKSTVSVGVVLPGVLVVNYRSMTREMKEDELKAPIIMSGELICWDVMKKSSINIFRPPTQKWGGLKMKFATERSLGKLVSSYDT